MPSLGSDMEAGILVEWMKQQGEKVSRGDIIAVVETDKGAIEVEVFEDGTLAELLVQPGEKVPVGTPLARITGPKDTASTERRHASAPAPTPAVPMPTVSSVQGAEAAIQPPTVTTLAEGSRATPAARLLASERGIDLALVKGTGPDGSIVRRDIEEAAPRAATVPDLEPMRRAIAAAMSRAKRDIPHYYLGHSFDVSQAVQWLDAYNAAHPPQERLLLGALTLKAVALALKDFPEFNGFYGPDGFVPASAIHIGTAIAMRGGGLAAPAIHNTDTLTLAELMERLRDLIGRVRKGGFRSSEISDPTITVSSLGDRGVDMLLPIIYPPQVAIIGFGSVAPRAWAIEDAVAVRPVLTATLAADHRASDGHRGALLLRRIGDLLDTPEDL